MRTRGSRNTKFAPDVLKMIWDEAYSSGTKDSRRKLDVHMWVEIPLGDGRGMK